VVAWELEDGDIVTNRNIASASRDWNIVDAADFDADGDADILFQHADGRVVTWEIEDGRLVRNHNINLASSSWAIEAVGDFDGDGDGDILWRHAAGRVVTWDRIVPDAAIQIAAEALELFPTLRGRILACDGQRHGDSVRINHRMTYIPRAGGNSVRAVSRTPREPSSSTNDSESQRCILCE
jgi:hypothetical protein